MKKIGTKIGPTIFQVLKIHMVIFVTVSVFDPENIWAVFGSYHSAFSISYNSLSLYQVGGRPAAGYDKTISAQLKLGLSLGIETNSYAVMLMLCKLAFI